MIAIATLMALAATPACVEVRGGAVEASWDLRDFSGQPFKDACEKARIESMRLCWLPVPDDAGPITTDCTIVRTESGFAELFREFDCIEQRGVTRFELAPGPNALFMQPVCAGGKSPTGPYQVPPPILRTVVSGEVVTLNQLLVVVDFDCSDGECTCPE